METPTANKSEYDYIPKEAAVLLDDSLRHRGKDPSRLSYKEKRQVFEDIYTKEVVMEWLKLHSDSFDSTDVWQELTAMNSLREQLNIPKKQHKLGEVVSLSEVVVAEGDDEVRGNYSSFFVQGIPQSILREKLRFQHEVAPKNLEQTIQNQSGDQYRSIVELTCNAVDFSDEGGTVSVSTQERGYTVRDLGKGMAPQQLFENLLIPKISGARERGKKSIGKFGVGFWTVLNHLQEDSDVITVKTAFEGKGYEIRFTMQQGEVMVELGMQEDIKQGTEVSIDCSGFDVRKAEEYLKGYLQYKRGTRIELNGVAINEVLSNSIRLETGAHNESTALSFVAKPERSFQSDICTISILINGVFIEDMYANGIDLPESLVLDLPYTVPLPESRNNIEFDEIAQGAVKNILTALEASDLPMEQIVQCANALSPLLSKLLERSSVITKKDNFHEVISSILERKSQAGDRFFPNEGEYPVIGGSASWYLDRRLPISDPLRSPSMKHKQELSSMTRTVYTENFASVDGSPIVIDDTRKMIIIDADVYERWKGNPVLFNIYFKEGYVQPLAVFPFQEELTTMEQVIPPRLGQRTVEDCILEMQKRSSKSHFFNNGQLLELLYGKIEKSPLYQEEFEDFNPAVHTDYYTFRAGDTEIQRTTSPEFMQSVQEYLSGSLSFDELRSRHESNADDANVLEDMAQNQDLLAVFDIAGKFNADFPAFIQKTIRSDNPGWLKDVLDKFVQLKKQFEELPQSNRYRSVLLSHFELVISDPEWSIRSMRISHTNPYGNIEKKLIQVFEYQSLLNTLYNHINIGKDEKKSTLKQAIVQGGIDKVCGLDYLTFLQNPQLIQDYVGLADLSPEMGSDYIEKIIYESPGYPLVKDTELFALLLADALPLVVAEKPSLEVLTKMRFYLSQPRTLDNMARSISASTFEEMKRFHITDTFPDREGRTKESMSANELLQVMNKNSEILRLGWPTIIQNITHLTELPAVKRLVEENAAAWMSFQHSSSKDYQTVHDSIFTARNAIQFAEQYTTNLSDTHLSIINEHVESQLRTEPIFSLMDCHMRTIYLSRCLGCGSYPDEVFRFYQPLLASYNRGYSSLYRRYQTYDHDTANIFPQTIFDAGIATHIYNNWGELDPKLLPQFADFWDAIASSTIPELAGLSITERLDRTLDIWRDISNRSQADFKAIFADLRSAKALLKDQVEMHSEWSNLMSSSSYIAGRDFGYFHDNYPLEQIPDSVRPYVLYLRNGEMPPAVMDASENVQAYQHSISLTDLSLARRLRSKTFMKQLAEDPGHFGEWVRGVSAEKDTFLQKRELLHGVYHQSASDPYLFLRELIQNSLDASKTAVGQAPSMHIDEYVSLDSHILKIEDYVGMNLETVLGYLLVPEMSTKGDESLGKFGVGFLTILRDAKQVDIQTEKDGRRLDVQVKPVIEDGVIVDLQVQYSETSCDPQSRRTTIYKHMKRDNSKLTSARIESAIYRYTKHVDPEELSIGYRDRKHINYSHSVTSEYVDVHLGSFRALESGNLQVTQGGLYVMDIPTRWLDQIPRPVRNIIIENGFVCDIPRSIPLTRSRNAIAQADRYEETLKKAITTLGINHFLNLFQNGVADYRMLPYDYFFTDGYPAGLNWYIEAGIVADAGLINEGSTPEDMSRYNNEADFLQLITTVNCINYQGQTISLRDLALMVSREEPVTLSALPRALAKKIELAIDYRESEKQSREIDEERIEKNVDAPRIKKMIDRPIQLDPETITRLTEASDTHLAFIDLCKTVIASCNLANNPIVGYIYSEAAMKAQANKRFKTIEFNLRSLDRNLARFKDVLQKKTTPQAVSDILLETITILTHELAHLELPANWALEHNDTFYNKQRDILARLMRSDIDLQMIIDDLSQRYTAGYLDAHSLLKILSEEALSEA